MVTLNLLSLQQFGIWLDSSSPEQTVPYLWSEETPTSESQADPPCWPLSLSLLASLWPSIKLAVVFLRRRRRSLEWYLSINQAC